MTERPIIMTSESVQAILAGRKSQTRRVIKPQPSNGIRRSPFVPSGLKDEHGREMRCPYGTPGDQLWVRETWRVEAHPLAGARVRYAAGGEMDITGINAPYVHREGWRSPLFMPRWASRIMLEITGVQVERLQDISNEDAMAEGVYEWYRATQLSGDEYAYWSPVNGSGAAQKFRELWDSINAKRGYPWASNPWVFVISFRRNDA